MSLAFARRPNRRQSSAKSSSPSFARVRTALTSKARACRNVRPLCGDSPAAASFPYDSVVVYEAPDCLGSPNAAFSRRSVRAVPSALLRRRSRAQRILQQPFSWKSSASISAAFPTRLRSNYRTSHQISPPCADRLFSPPRGLDGRRHEETCRGPPSPYSTVPSADSRFFAEPREEWTAVCNGSHRT